MKQGKRLLIGIFIFLLLAGGTGYAGTLITSAAASERQEQQLVDVRKAPKYQGRWIKTGKRYKFRKRGGRYAGAGWFRFKDGIYCLNQDGYRITGWHTYRGKRYFLDNDGQMHSGWLRRGTHRPSRYYFQKSGVMAAQRWIRSKGQHYYLRADGKMATGWLKLKGNTYYLDRDGTRVTGVHFVKGKGYYFDRKGRLIPGRKVTEREINPRKKMIALTFDDGPGPHTRRLLRCLSENRSVATFFVVGNRVKGYRDVLRRADQIGCEIANHTWDHPELNRLDSGAVRAQISRTDQAVRAATGKTPRLLRPPYGAYNERVAQAAGKPLILWDLDTQDWRTRDSARTVQSVSSAKDGSVVLMHDIHLPTVIAAETVIPRLIKNGYQLVTVSELAKYKKITVRSGRTYSSFH